MRCILQHLTSRTWPDMVIDYHNIQRLVPLRKANQGIRPVCIPSVWRKVIALCCLDRWKSKLSSAAGDFQFGCGRPHGTLAYAAAIQRHLNIHASHLCIQLDLKDAFNGIDRREAYRQMAECDSSFVASQGRWIGHADWLSGPESPDYNFLSQVMQGVPQGDPLSGYVFGMVLAKAVRDLRTHLDTRECVWGTDYEIMAFADDLVILASDDWAQIILDSLASLIESGSVAPEREDRHLPSMRDLSILPIFSIHVGGSGEKRRHGLVRRTYLGPE